MSFGGIQPGIILLREGTDTSQGTPQMISNINACCAVAEIVQTTLGPRGMDKLIYASGSTTVTNDGATVMKLLNIVHPAASTLVDIAKSQDAQVGDGTTSVVVLAASLLAEAKSFLEDGVHPQTIVNGYVFFSLSLSHFIIFFQILISFFFFFFFSLSNKAIDQLVRLHESL